MKSCKHYIRDKKENKGFIITAVIVLILLTALMVMTICGVFEDLIWKPGVVYPMANQHIEWTYAGRK